MKLLDIAKNLANRINQEHYIEHELKKVFDTAYKLGFEEANKQNKALQLKQTGVSGCFTLSDLVELQGSIQIPKLTEKVIDEGFASWLEEELESKGHNIRWVSLDDMGFISVTFFDRHVTDERMLLVVDILNNR